MNANGFGVKMYRIALNIIRKQFIPINLLQCEMRACCGRARLTGMKQLLSPRLSSCK